MSSKWDQYAVETKDSNKWDQYSVDEPSTLKEVARESIAAPLTGFLGAYGNLQNLIAGGNQERLSPGQKALTTAEQQIPESQLPFLQDEDILPQLSKLPTTQESRDILGVPEPQTFLGGATKRGGEFFGGGVAFGANPMTNILMSARAGLGGETAKVLGFGPTGQAIAETISAGIPSLKKAIKPSAAQKEAVDFLRRQGLSEEQIAPLIQSERKIGFFSALAKRGRRAQNKLQDSQKGLSEIYDRLGNRPSANIKMNPEQAQTFANEISQVARELPAEVRKLVYEDALDLARDGFTGKGLMNFYKDLNSYFPRGAKQLGLFKDPITNALERFSPKLAEEFRLTTKLQKGYYQIAGKLKSNIVDQFVSASEIGRVLYGAFSGNIPLLVETIGEDLTRRLAREVLLNPRFQNLSRKTIQALNSGKTNLANSYIDKIGTEISKKDKKLGNQIREFDVNQIFGEDINNTR